VSSMRYELGFYIPEDVILLSYPRMNLKSYRKLSATIFSMRRYSCLSLLSNDPVLFS
jgi:hypothetical protein